MWEALENDRTEQSVPNLRRLTLKRKICPILKRGKGEIMYKLQEKGL
jgi:hypothetical protein